MSAPGVVVVPDGHASQPHVHDLREELTMAGFAVELVDLPTDPFPDRTADPTTDPTADTTADPTTDGHRGGQVAPGARGPDAVASVAAAAGRLRAAGSTVVGAVGFARGGDVVLRAAHEGGVDAVVAYYPSHGPAADPIACPVQLHLAGADPGPAPAVVAGVAALEAAGTPVDTFVYPGTGHRFANPHESTTRDGAAADVALARTIGFLHARLAR